MRLLFLVLMLLAHPAMAEVARLNSGEHTDFSRLVITLASPSPWSLMRDGQAQVLNFERAGITFDTSTVFDRIPRSRIADLQQQQGQSSLRIGLACDCTATAFEFRPGIIVVDVRANPASDPKTELLTETPTMEGISAEDMLRQQLVRQLAAGAARGVVELALAPAPDAGPVLGSQSGIRLLQEPGVSMRQGGSEVTPAPDNRCIPDSELAIGDWEGAGDDPLAAKPGRAELLDALDRPIPEHVSSYVRYLIWLGFGAEARAVLNAFGSDLASIETLQSLAYLVDAEDDPLNTFAGMERCETSAALWAVLSRAVIRPSESLAVPAILRAFADLPVHLRRHFGLALVERFKAQGASDAAAQIARSLERGAGPTDPAVRLIDGTLDGSDESLISLSQESRSMEVDALVALIDASFQRHDRVESTVVENLAALLHAHGGDPTRASRLRRALALANALNGSFDEAFALAGDDQVTTLGLWALLPITANDGAFLEYAVRPRGEPL